MAPHILGKQKPILRTDAKGQRQYTEEELKHAADDVAVLLKDDQVIVPHLVAAAITARRLYLLFKGEVDRRVAAWMDEANLGDTSGVAGIVRGTNERTLPLLKTMADAGLLPPAVPDETGLKALMVAATIAQRTYVVLRLGLGEELNGWTQTNPELIAHILSGAILEQGSKPLPAAELVEAVTNHLLPILKNFEMMEQEKLRERTTDEISIVSGGDGPGAQGLEDVFSPD